METSLRYSKSLRIHAKEKLPFNSKTHLQLHGELDTGSGSPSYFSAMIRHLFPHALTGLGVGFHYDKRHKLRCHVRGKKEFPLKTDNLVTFNIKGRCDFDQDFNQSNTMNMEIYGIISDINPIAAAFEVISFCWIPREKNNEANFLAKQCLSFEQDLYALNPVT